MPRWRDVLADVRGVVVDVVPGGSGDTVDLDPVVVDATHDSRQAAPGWLFCCVRGDRADGHAFASDAVAAGAVALVVDHPVDVAVPQAVVRDVRAATGAFAAAVHGHPSDHLTMVGVTGTNGKTTTTHLVGQILEAVGRRVEVIGTLSGSFTTPEAPDLHRRLAHAVARGVDTVVMEVSSHALALHRVVGARFDVAAFTNLGRDHLDLHGTMERYFEAKATLFTPDLSARGVVNVDDEHGRVLLDRGTIPLVGFSHDELGDIVVGPTSHGYRWRGLDVTVPLGGSFNVENSLAAATVCSELGVDDEAVVAALAGVRAVPGRLESIEVGQPFSVLVDFAHTPEGLVAVLTTLRESMPVSGSGRLIVVFGAGGDRDRDKRPEMGAVASRLADAVIVTSDNPRSEDPDEIIDAIIRGVPADYRERVTREPDRADAIAAAVGLAAPGDVVVIAGKGHESTQTIGAEVRSFDDRVVARAALVGIGHGPADDGGAR